MLVMDVRGLNGADRAYARFWNHVHSIDSALTGVKLGLWLDRPPAVGPEAGASGGVIVAFGWPTGGDQFQTATVAMGADAMRAFTWKDVRAVALARFELPTWSHDLLAQRLGYSATIPGQVSGWWTDATTTPASRPSGALLPEGGSLADQRECLVLVDVDDWWGVLSTLGLGNYTFGSQLEAGEAISFLDEQGRRWAVRRVEDVPTADIAARWGTHAAERARPNVPAVRIRVSSIN